MGAKFVPSDHGLLSLEELEQRASKFAGKKYGIIHWVGSQVFFGCEHPEHDIKPKILLATIIEEAKSTYHGIRLSRIKILIGVDAEDGAVRYQFFLEGEDTVEFEPKEIKEIIRL
jgi:hypothetical protein